MRVTITCPRAPATLEWIEIMQRSLHAVTVVDSLRFPIGRYVPGVRFIRIPPPKFDFTNYKKAILAIIAESDLVIPTCEDVFYISLVAEEAGLSHKVFMPERALLVHMHNKFTFREHMNEYAKAPDMRLIEHIDQIDTSAKDTLLKPVFSRFGTNIIRTITKESIRSIEVSETYPWVQQQFINGTYLCNYAIIQHGKVIAHVVYTPKYLVNNAASTYFELNKSDKCERFIRKFAEDTGYNGQVAFDFIDTGTDLYVLECNPRATSGLHLISRSLSFKDGAFVTNGTEPFESCRVSKSIYFMFGLAYARTGRIKELIRDYKKARDVVGRVPIRAQLLSFLEITAIRLRRKISFASATTYDIEYNG